MSGGTVTAISVVKDTTGTITTGQEEYEGYHEDTLVTRRVLVDETNDNLIIGTLGQHVNRHQIRNPRRGVDTIAINWNDLLSKIIENEEIEIGEKIENIWETQKLQRLVNEPVGSPIELTKEEADEVVRLAYGRRPDLLPGKELTEQIRGLLGHSLIERIGKVEHK